MSVCGRHTECNLSHSDSLAYELPCPLTAMDDTSGFCHYRPFLWIQWNQGLRQEKKKKKGVPESWEGKTEKRSHITEFSLLNTLQPPRSFCFSSHSSHSHLRAFALTLPLESHFIHLFLGKAIPTAHTAGPSRSCPVPLCSRVLLYFTSQNFLLPEIILFVVITCCYSYLSRDSLLLEYKL